MYPSPQKTVTRLEQSLSEAMEALNREQEGARLQQREREMLVRMLSWVNSRGLWAVGGLWEFITLVALGQYFPLYKKGSATK